MTADSIEKRERADKLTRARAPATLPPGDRRVRVLRIIARMNVGGPALQVTNLCRYLDRERFEQRLLVGSVGEGEGDYLALRAPDVRAERVPGLGRAPRPTDDGKALLAIRRAIADFHPHIVHTHTAKAGALGRIAAVTSRVPVRVHTFHGHVLHGYFSPATTRAVVVAERALARITTRLVAVGERVRDELLAARIGRASQYVVVPPGVHIDEPPERAEARRTLGFADEDLVVTFVGRLTPIKRPDRFVAMAERIVPHLPTARFVVAGDGELGNEVRTAAARLGDRFRVLGWRSDVETVHAASDVVVLTSDNEGMPVSLIEAGLVGRATVTTRVGSAAEVVEDGVTGLVVDRDVDALAAAVCGVLQDEGRRRAMEAAARERCRSRFSAERLADDTARLYEELTRG